MKRICVLVFALSLAAWPQTRKGPFDRDHDDPLDQKLPSGKSLRDEIAKADYKRNVEDAGSLARLAAEVHDDLEKSESGVVSVKMLKKLDDIEKLTRTIRSRLKRY